MLNIYGIHTQKLTLRAERFHDLLQKLRVAAVKHGYHVNIRLILKPDVVDVQELMKQRTQAAPTSATATSNADATSNISTAADASATATSDANAPASTDADANTAANTAASTAATAPAADTRSDLEKRVCYDPSGDVELDNLRQVFTMELISNFEKHRAAWSRIASSKEDESALHMVIEDDSFLLPDGINTWNEVMTAASKPDADWDLIMLGLAQLDAKDVLADMRQFVRILPSKDAYLIKPALARRLCDDQQFRFPVRIQMSQFILNNADVRVVCPNKRFLLDGSKLGVFASSIHPNNVLVFNNEFITLLKAYNQALPFNDQTQRDINLAYTSLQQINCPEGIFMMAKLMEKMGDTAKAYSMYVQAFEQFKKSQGIINGRSDTVTSIINLSASNQPDVAKCKSIPGKYATPEAAMSDY